MPGMGSSSPLPAFLKMTVAEMEEYVADLQSRMHCYVFAVDMSSYTVLDVVVNDLTDTYHAQTDDSGLLTEEFINNYLDSLSFSQGQYETITHNGKDYFIFPDYQAGYKICTLMDTADISVLCNNPIGKINDATKFSAFSVITSVCEVN
jgi:hypothetical protein